MANNKFEWDMDLIEPLQIKVAELGDAKERHYYGFVANDSKSVVRSRVCHMITLLNDILAKATELKIWMEGQQKEHQ